MTKKSRPQARPRPTPRRERPSVEELGGISEYQVRSASDLEEGDPIQSVVQPAADEDADLMGPSIATGQPKGGPPNEQISVAPDELGAHYLRRAVQDPRPEEPDEELPASEEAAMSAGEKRMLEARPGDVETEGEIITRMPQRTEQESQLSELGREAVHEAQQARRGPRGRRASEQTTKARKIATRRASERH